MCLCFVHNSQTQETAVFLWHSSTFVWINSQNYCIGVGRTAEPSRETKFSGTNEDREIIIFPVRLTTSIGLATLPGWSILLLYVCDDDTYMLYCVESSVCRSPDKYWAREPSSSRLPLTSSCDPPLLFIYFQVNNGVLYFLAYVEDIYIMVLSVLVSILNLNHTTLCRYVNYKWALGVISCASGS